MISTNINHPFFILAGNGSYENRGCEAIMRGTVEIIRQYFNDPKFLVLSHYGSYSEFRHQKTNETDKALIHKKSKLAQRRFNLIWLLRNGLRFLYPKGKSYLTYMEMLPFLKNSMAVLSVGGDNYSLDYGIPSLFTDLDDLVLAKKKPMIIWGASIGPFSKMPKYEEYMIKHLRRIDGIFVRESATIKYLKRKGITENVYLVADPAFFMKPFEPAKEKLNMEIPEKAIGINLSPLLARYVTGGNIKKWTKLAANIIMEVSQRTNRPIVLIPHDNRFNMSDYGFLKNALSLINEKKSMISLIPPNFTAPEVKWVISKMDVFAGARTHATIAALSSSVPTISFAYSIKAQGINRDFFGDTQFCIDPYYLSITPSIVTDKILELIEHAENIKEKINISLSRIEKLSMDAGKYLKEIVEQYK